MAKRKQKIDTHTILLAQFTEHLNSRQYAEFKTLEEALEGLWVHRCMGAWMDGFGYPFLIESWYLFVLPCDGMYGSVMVMPDVGSSKEI